MDPIFKVDPGHLTFIEKDVKAVIEVKDQTSTKDWFTDYYTKKMNEARQVYDDLYALSRTQMLTKSEQKELNWAQREYSKVYGKLEQDQHHKHLNASGFQWTKSAKTTMTTATKLIRALNPRVNVRWDVDQTNIGTDFSHLTNAKKHTWTIHLDPTRLTFGNKHQQTAVEQPTIQMIQSCIGAAIHETAHTLYTPDMENFEDWLKTYEQLCVFRIYEDAYINQYIIKNRLPGAMPFLHSANIWTNPAYFLNDFAQSMYKTPNNGPQTFEQYLAICAGADYLGAWTNQAYKIYLPDDLCRDITEQIYHLRQEVTAGEYVDPDRRAQVYQEIADLITVHAPPAIHSSLDDIQWTTNERGGTETPLDQKLNGDAEDGDDETEETLREIVKYLEKCSGQTSSQQQLPAAIAQKLANENSKAETAETDGVAQLDNIDYSRTQPNSQHITVDQNRIDKLRQIFRTKSAIRRNFVHGLSEGRISNRKIHRLLHPKPSENIFKRRPHLDTAAAAIMILVDGSGSMAGAPYQTASSAAKELYEALSANKDYKLTLWNYTSIGPKLNIVSGWHDGNQLHWPEVKNGGTPSYQAMVTAHQYLVNNYRNSQKIIIHFTDLGWSDQNNSDFDALLNDDSLKFMTVTVATPSCNNLITAAQQRTPEMHVSGFDTNNLAAAVQEFILDALY